MRHVLILCFIYLTALTLQAKTRVEIAEENSPAVVAVNVLRTDGSTFTGTGFVVSSDGVIATASHVTNDALFLNLTFNTGAVSGQAEVLSLNKKVDLALLKIAARDLPTVQLANSDYVLPGQEITVIGNPRRLQNTISSGLISQVRKRANGILWHQISAPISPSSSGSPVFNEDGQVVGVAFGSYKGEGNQNLNFAVPSNYLTEMIRKAGYQPPLVATEENASVQNDLSPWDRFTHHLKLCWESTCRLFNHNRQ